MSVPYLVPPHESKSRRTLLLAALLAAHAALTLLMLALVSSLANGAPIGNDVLLIMCPLGYFFGQSTLLGICAALGPGRTVVRVPLMLFCLGLTTLCAQAAQLGFFGGDLTWPEITLITSASVVAPFLLLQLLWLPRALFGLRLATSGELQKASGGGRAQFSILQLLIWTCGVAVLLAVARYFVPESVRGDINGVIILYMSLWLLFTVGISCLLSLGIRMPYYELWQLGVVVGAGAGVVGATIVEVAIFEEVDGSPLELILPLRITQILLVTLTLLPLRLAGYRLRRLRRVPKNPAPLPVPTTADQANPEAETATP